MGLSEKDGPMGRNEFEASHYCPKVERVISFSALIGNVVVCPECRKYVDTSSPIFIGTPRLPTDKEGNEEKE